MADQIERLIAAVEDVSRKLTRLSTYSNILYMGRGSTAVSSAVSAFLGVIKVTKSLAGTVAAVSSAAGAMAIEYFRGGGSVSASGGAAGAMDISRQMSGSVVAVSGVADDSTLEVYSQVLLAGVCTAKVIIGGAHLEV